MEDNWWVGKIAIDRYIFAIFYPYRLIFPQALESPQKEGSKLLPPPKLKKTSLLSGSRMRNGPLSGDLPMLGLQCNVGFCESALSINKSIFLEKTSHVFFLKKAFLDGCNTMSYKCMDIWIGYGYLWMGVGIEHGANGAKNVVWDGCHSANYKWIEWDWMGWKSQGGVKYRAA